MKKVLIGSLIGASVLLSGCGNTLSEQWYDYGKGMINLENVNHIKGAITLSYVKQYDKNFKFVCPDAKDGGEWTNPLTSSDTDIINYTLQNVVQNNCYKNIKVSSYIKFDNFTLTLFDSQNISKKDLGKVKNDLKDALNTYKSIYKQILIK